MINKYSKPLQIVIINIRMNFFINNTDFDVRLWIFEI